VNTWLVDTGTLRVGIGSETQRVKAAAGGVPGRHVAGRPDRPLAVENVLRFGGVLPGAESGHHSGGF